MINRFKTLITFRVTLIISLFLITVLISGFGFSCQAPVTEVISPSPGAGASAEPNSEAILPIEVLIAGFAFKPATLNIPVGTTVTWHNNDSVIHTATARDDSFDSGSLSLGDTFTYTFEEKGTFEYYCRPHPYMIGQVIVE